MRIKNNKNNINEDDAPELNRELSSKLLAASELLPPDLYSALIARKPGQRGKQKNPTKKPVYLRLDPEVLEHFKSTGRGWQSRINNFLKVAVLSVSISPANNI